MNFLKVSLAFGLFLFSLGTIQSQNGELIVTTPDLSIWTCEIGEVQTFIWRYNYTKDGIDKECDNIDPESVELSIDPDSGIEIVGGPSVEGCFVSLNFICNSDAPFELEICVNASDVAQANGIDFTSADDDGVGCYKLVVEREEEEEEEEEVKPEDSDNDGVPDSEDCAPNDPNASASSDPCDDGDANTMNDQYDTDCNCNGQVIDSDGDGVPDSEDCAPNDPNASGSSDACDDGDATTVNDQYDSNCNCSGEVIDSDGDGVADSEDCAPNDPNAASRFDACDDGNPNTFNDQYDSNCNCRGREVDSDGDGVADSRDCAPDDPNASSRGDACDDGDSDTENDQYDSNCNCRGQVIDRGDDDGDGVINFEDCAPNDPNASSRFDACDDGNPDTVNDQYDSNCNCRGRAIDSDNDGVPDNEDCAPNDPNASSRFDACDDGNPNTMNDQYDSNCNCRGTEVVDSDNDGVPDSEDCAPSDPNASRGGDACDDGNPNTVNDQYDSNCNCNGEEQEPTITFGQGQSVVFFDLNECFSRTLKGADDYSEFTASNPNALDCATFTSSTLQRANPDLNKHSCTPGAGGTSAMCVAARIECDYSKTSDQALVFEVQIDATDLVSITGLKFLEKAPEQFEWIGGISGANNYPTRYGVRVLLDGSEVFFEDNIATTPEWTEETFSFDDIIIDASATIVVQMLAYCPVGNGASLSVWDVENVELLAACGTSSSSSIISGVVTSMDNAPLSDVLLSLEGSDFQRDYMTSSDGLFDFGEVAMSDSYFLSATKRTEYLKGVSTLDLVSLQKHILGIEVFEGAFRYIAADVNKDNKVSATDIIELRKLILGVYDELPNNDSYRFYDQNETIDATNPWMIPEDLYLSNLEDFGSTINFSGIKIGDVNSIQAEKRSRDNSVLNYKIRNASDAVNKSIVDFYFEDEEQFEAIQLNLFLRDAAIEELISGQLKLESDNYNILDGHELRISLNFEELNTFNSDEPMFSIVLDTDKVLDQLTMIQDVLINSELYNSNRDFRSLDIKAMDEISVSENSLVFYPNPFSDELFVALDLESESEVSIEIFDVTGRKLYNYSNRLNAGKNTLKLDDMPRTNTSAVLISRVSIGNEVYTNKIMQAQR